MIIGFHSSGHLSERGTCVALFDYAYYNQKINGKSIIFYDKNNPFNVPRVIEKFKKEFEVIAYTSFSEIELFNLDYFYNIKKSNENFQLTTSFVNLSHVVFELNNDLFHENEVVSVISKDVKNWNSQPVVPHMINLPSHQENMRKTLNLPETAIVYGRYGGFYDFDIDFVHQAIIEIVNEQTGIYFLFANTSPFYIHPRIIYLDQIIDLEEKVKFINSCDAMIHGRIDGESFGLSIGEFSSSNKPVITTYGNYNHHISILGERAIIYNSKESLKIILRGNFISSRNDWNAYSNYTPEKVMQKFNEVFLKNDITIVTAFYDIGRENWTNYSRSIDEYLNSFKEYLKLDYNMIVFMDSKLNEKYIPIDLDFLKKNTCFSDFDTHSQIMNSEYYRNLISHRDNPENKYPEYNLINHSKIDFIKYSLDHGLIKGSFVCWSDFGYHHLTPNDLPTDLLDISRFNKNKINVCCLEKPTFYNAIETLKSGKVTITGTFYGLPKKLINTFHSLYHTCLDELCKMGIVDDDQHVLERCYFKNPELFECYQFDSWPLGLNYFQKNRLTKLMNDYGSDKGTFHNYTTFYEQFKMNDINLFELGLGTNNPNLPSSMGVNGKSGASLFAWRDYCSGSNIYGADIDRDILFTSDRIKTFYCDQRSPEIIKEMWESINCDFDIIIDDGLHELSANICFFENSIFKLKTSGNYFIEDIHKSELDEFYKQIEIWKNIYCYLDFKLIKLPHPTNIWDNNILWITHKKVCINVHTGCGLGNTLKTFISWLSINKNTKIKSNDQWIAGDYDSILKNYKSTETGSSFYFGWRFFILNEEPQQNILNEFSDEKYENCENFISNKTFIDFCYDRKNICDQVYNRIINTIRSIKWNDSILSEVEKFKISPNTLGISVRTCKSIHESGVDRKYNKQDYFDAINSFYGKVDNLIISFDNLSEEKEYLPILSKFNYTVFRQSENMTFLQYSTIKLLVLSKCDHFIGSRISTFTELVYWFSGMSQNIITLF